MNIKEKIAYEIQNPARKKILRRSYKLPGINETLQIDLIDMQKYSWWNNGNSYILPVIDTFSKKAYAVPLKNKEGLPVTEGMKTILKSISKGVRNIQSDQGNTFFNKHSRALMKAHNINHYHTFSTTKAAIVERFQRTLNNWLYREFSAQGSYYWLNILPKLISKYNNKVNRSIGMKPNQVNSKNSKYVHEMLNTKKSVFTKAKFKLGDTVRISKYKHIFDKSYTLNLTTELFTIAEVKNTKPVTYILTDEDGELIKGGFYDK